MASTAPPGVHLLDRDEYDRMVQRGALDGLPVELIDGFLAHMSPQGPRHVALVQALVRVFAGHLDLMRVQMPLAAGVRSEPELDLALVGHSDPERHPSTAMLVVEVAVTSQDQDEHKAATYAGAAVPLYWLVDGSARQVIVFTEPGPVGYERRVTLSGDDPLEAPVATEALTVDGLFARARLT